MTNRKVTFRAPPGTRVSLGVLPELDFGDKGELTFDENDPWVDRLEENYVVSESHPITSQPASEPEPEPAPKAKPKEIS